MNLWTFCNIVTCTLSPVLPIPLQVKCDQYWPVRGTETYGLIQVTLVDTVELATYTMRTFALHKVWPRVFWAGRGQLWGQGLGGL